jgi:hypothetical protein
VDLRAVLLRRTRPRPFVVAGVGGRDARLAVERLVGRRGWRPALSPAEANMLVVCGPESNGLADVLDRLWEQVASPRVRTRVVTAQAAEAMLREAEATLVDWTHQRHDASSRPTEPPGTHRTHGDAEHHPIDHSGHGHDHGKRSGNHNVHPMADPGVHGVEPAGHGMAHAGDETEHGGEHGGHGPGTPGEHDRDGHSGHAMGGHGGHAGHDMGGMQMPGGLAMAERGADRDGLTLDRLQVPLGPALSQWPAGLGLGLTVQGDVVQNARVRIFTNAGEVVPWWTASLSADGLEHASVSRSPFDGLDSLQRLLCVAGWPVAALAVRRLRDDLAEGADTPAVHRAYRSWSRRVRRSRLLRWSTNGLGVLGQEVPAPLRGDATARWLRWLDVVDAALAGPGGPPVPQPGVGAAAVARAAVDVLPSLVVGQELAAVRLIVASLDPDLDALVAAEKPEPAHG